MNDFGEDLTKAMAVGLESFPGVKEMKPEQKLVVENVVRGREVFASLPTGFGKSLTFQILPIVLKSLRSLGHDFPPNPLVVVVSPLTSIVKDQVKYLRSIGFDAAFIVTGESLRGEA